MGDRVRAAGGMIVRPAASGTGVEVLLVHRPRYDDWSLPKGKAEAGESDEDCARREVEEETGLRCRLGEELPTVHYTDQKGRPKQVRYWRMEVEGGAFVANDEVDEARWVARDDALGLLTYDHDVDLVRDALAR